MFQAHVVRIGRQLVLGTRLCPCDRTVTLTPDRLTAWLLSIKEEIKFEVIFTKSL